VRVSPRNMKHRGFVVNERSARLEYRNTNGNCLDHRQSDLCLSARIGAHRAVRQERQNAKSFDCVAVNHEESGAGRAV